VKSKTKWPLSLAGTALVLAAIFYARNKIADQLEGTWMINYGAYSGFSVDDGAARSAAKKMAWFDPKWSAFYLGHMAVSNAITMPDGPLKIAHLKEALRRLEPYSFEKGRATIDASYLKAALSAMLNDETKAEVYAKEACAAYRQPTKGIGCVRERYEYRLDDPMRSRVDAVELYEMIELMKLLGGQSTDELRFGEAVALLYFDPPAARQQRDQLQSARAFTPRRLEIYCRTVRYVGSTDGADKALCTQSVAR
jgi:hypothetical protein